MKEYVTACPRNCYSTCSFRVQVENNKIRRILPVPENRATPEGPCIKGLSYIERTHSAERIIFPLLKDKSGNFKRISVNEALEIISEKLISLKEKYGPHSVLWYRGSGMAGLTNEIGSSFWKEYGGATTTYGNLCWPAGLEAVRLTMGSVKHNVPWDLENAKTIVIWGKNPAETNIQEISFIAKAREIGCKIIVIDPLRTPTADKADIFISPKTGTDGALALAIAGVLIEKNLIDHEYITKNVNGFDEFRNSLNISPSDAESITGIPANEIIKLSAIIGAGSPVTFLPGYGLQRHQNGGQTIRAILSLAVITGNLGKSGAGFNYANLQSYIFDSIKEPLSYYPDKENDKPFRRTLSMAKLGSDMLNTQNPGLKAAWIERGNPILQSPDSVHVKKAIESMEFVIVADQFMTDTAALADIILPAKDLFEQSDILGSYWSPYIQFKPKIIEAPGEVLPESEIYFRLARMMNMKISTEHLPEPGNENIEKWLEKRINGYSNLTLDDLRKGPVLAPGLEEIAYSEDLFETESGKIELFSNEAERKWGVSPLPEYIPVVSSKEYPLEFLTPNAGNRIHSQFGNLKIIKSNSPVPALLVSPDDAETRYIETGSRVRVYNENGEIFSVAEVSNRIPIGTIVLPNGIWLLEGGGGNFLIPGRETDMGYGAAFHDSRVQLEKIE
jgi:anaerobic selenocysteine-containing dehydrogenase